MGKGLDSNRSFADPDHPVQSLLRQLQIIFDTPRLVETPEELENLEEEIRLVTAGIEAQLVRQQIEYTIHSSELKESVKLLLKSSSKPFRNQGRRPVTIRTSNGTEVTVHATYWSRSKNKKPKKKRGSGFYFELILLGIFDRCTPGLSAKISQTEVALGSMMEACDFLRSQGITMDIKGMRMVCYRFAERARLMQKDQLLPAKESLAKKRVVISCDGGRVRIRENKKGRKTKKRRHRFSTDWREPKLFIIYTVTNDGRLDKQIPPIIDGTMKGPEEMFCLMEGYLSFLGINQCDRIVLIADGAQWIWNRFSKLVEHLRLSKLKVLELIDFYHAVEHLSAVTNLRASWTGNERKKWLRKYRSLLSRGEVDRVIKAIGALCRGRRGKAIQTHKRYFEKNRARMAFHQAKKEKLPQGSGAVESAIRRVINLRLKGAGTFWKEENAESMLCLRGFYKSGRWEMMKRLGNPNIINKSN